MADPEGDTQDMEDTPHPEESLSPRGVPGTGGAPGDRQGWRSCPRPEDYKEDFRRMEEYFGGLIDREGFSRETSDSLRWLRSAEARLQSMQSVLEAAERADLYPRESDQQTETGIREEIAVYLYPATYDDGSDFVLWD